MSESTSPSTGAREPGLFARLLGIIFSPRETYAAVVRRPRALGALAVTLVLLGAIQGTFLSTDVGKEALMDQQVKTLESFGVNISDQMYAQMESRLAYAPYTTVAGQAVFIPLTCAVVAGLLLGVFGMLLGGTATFKQTFSVVAHSGFLLVLQALVSTPLSYLKGEFTSLNLAALVPMFEETSFVSRFLGGIDFVLLWWAVNLAIGVAVLFKRRTGPIAVNLLGLYVFIALILALARSGS